MRRLGLALVAILSSCTYDYAKLQGARDSGDAHGSPSIDTSAAGTDAAGRIDTGFVPDAAVDAPIGADVGGIDTGLVPDAAVDAPLGIDVAGGIDASRADVSSIDAGSAGTGGTGGLGGTGAGGATGGAGGTGTGGGQGGFTGAGGTVSSGGGVSLGGTVGTGGAPATGGTPGSYCPHSGGTVGANGDVSGMQAAAVWPMWRGGPFHAAKSPVALPGALSPSWSYSTGGGVVRGHAVVAADGTIYFGDSKGQLTALREDGAFVFTYQATASIEGTPAIASDGSVLFITQNGKLYAVDATSHLKKWEYSIGGASAASPTIGPDGHVYFTDEGGYVHAVDSLSGTRLWKVKQGDGGSYSSRTSVAIGLDCKLYVPQPGQKPIVLLALNPGDGSKIWGANPVAANDSTQETSALVGANGDVIFGGMVLNPLNGQVKVSATPYSDAWGWWGLTGGFNGVLYAGRKGSISALSSVDLSVKWLSGSLTMTNATCPLIGPDGNLYGAGWGPPNGTYMVNSLGTKIIVSDKGMMQDVPAPGHDGRLIVSSDDGIVTFAP